MNPLYEIGSEFHIESAEGSCDLPAYLTEEAAGAGYGITFLRCGRDSLGYIADDICLLRGGKGETGSGGKSEPERLRIFMPALCCDSMILPFSVRGYEVVFFRVKEDLTIDTDHLLGLIGGAAEDADEGPIGGAAGDASPVVLVMDYYGLTPVEDAKRRIREAYPDAVIIEDVTHRVPDAKAFLKRCVKADYYIGSIRKWMGVPDGAFVMQKGPGHAIESAGDTDFTTLRLKALKEKKEYLDSADRPKELKDHFRGLLSDAEDSLDDGREPYAISQTSLNLLKSVDLSGMSRARHENFIALKSHLMEDKYFGELFDILNPDAPVPDTPFMLPVVMHIDRIREKAQGAAGRSITRDRFETKLASRGVYAPVLWPIDAVAAEACPAAAYFAQNMLAFYIDHRYTTEHMRHAADMFCEELDVLMW
ncbi:MAG: hypothetical protein J5509_04965 [Lachnospiraceae bacterium]|nr:hypothetical protein [Lachnospiraceae bacterium]